MRVFETALLVLLVACAIFGPTAAEVVSNPSLGWGVFETVGVTRYAVLLVLFVLHLYVDHDRPQMVPAYVVVCFQLLYGPGSPEVAPDNALMYVQVVLVFISALVSLFFMPVSKLLPPSGTYNVGKHVEHIAKEQKDPTEHDLRVVCFYPTTENTGV
jgi:hypothetical protein